MAAQPKVRHGVHFHCVYDKRVESARLNALRLALHTYIMLGIDDKAYRVTRLLTREATRNAERCANQ